MLKHIIAILLCAPIYAQETHMYAQAAQNGPNIVSSLKETYFDIKSEKFAKHTVFFYGENHPYEYADSLSIEVFKKLVKENSTKVFCLEVGKSVEYLFYYYLKNQNLKSNTADPFDRFDSFTKKFKDHFFKSLARLFHENDSLIFRSYDIETSLDIAMNVLYHILTSSSNSIYFFDIREKIQTLPLIKNKMYARCRLFIRLFNENRILFEEKLSPYDFYYVNKIVEGMRPGIVSDSLELKKGVCESYIYREQFMHENFNEVLKEEPGKNIFVRGGAAHIMSKSEFDKCFYLEKCRDYFPFITRLNNIDYIKMNCLYPEERHYVNRWFLSKDERLEITGEIPSLSKGRFTFFDLSKSKSLFDTSFDYIILCY